MKRRMKKRVATKARAAKDVKKHGKGVSHIGDPSASVPGRAAVKS